jgi:glutamate synthase domain-containing protein 2
MTAARRLAESSIKHAGTPGARTRRDAADAGAERPWPHRRAGGRPIEPAAMSSSTMLGADEFGFSTAPLVVEAAS